MVLENFHIGSTGEGKSKELLKERYESHWCWVSDWEGLVEPDKIYEEKSERGGYI